MSGHNDRYMAIAPQFLLLLHIALVEYFRLQQLCIVGYGLQTRIGIF